MSGDVPPIILILGSSWGRVASFQPRPPALSQGKRPQYPLTSLLEEPQNLSGHFNRLMPNDPYMGRNAPLTSKRCILYIYSTNIGTE